MTKKLLPAKKRTTIGSRRSPETEAAVLTAAKELIGEKGYAGFSVDEVARRAGARWAGATAIVVPPMVTAMIYGIVPIARRLSKNRRENPSAASQA